MFLPQARERRNRPTAGRSNRSRSRYGIPVVPRLDDPGGGERLSMAGSVNEKTEPPAALAAVPGHAPLRSPQHRESADCHRQGLPKISSPLSGQPFGPGTRSESDERRSELPFRTNYRELEFRQGSSRGGRGGNRPQRNGFPSPRPEELLVGTNESSHHSWDATSSGLKKIREGVRVTFSGGRGPPLRRDRQEPRPHRTRVSTSGGPSLHRYLPSWTPSLPRSLLSLHSP